MDNYLFEEKLIVNDGLWEEYRHAIVHDDFTTKDLINMAKTIHFKFNKLEDVALVKHDLSKIMIEKANKKCNTAAECKQSIDQALLSIANAMDYFDKIAVSPKSDEDDDKDAIMDAYKLWETKFLSGKKLNNVEREPIEKITTLLECFVELGECYARLREIVKPKEYLKDPELQEFLIDCKNDYRNILCHRLLCQQKIINESNSSLETVSLDPQNFLDMCYEGLRQASKYSPSTQDVYIPKVPTEGFKMTLN